MFTGKGTARCVIFVGTPCRFPYFWPGKISFIYKNDHKKMYIVNNFSDKLNIYISKTVIFQQQ